MCFREGYSLELMIITDSDGSLCSIQFARSPCSHLRTVILSQCALLISM